MSQIFRIFAPEKYRLNLFDFALSNCLRLFPIIILVT